MEQRGRGTQGVAAGGAPPPRPVGGFGASSPTEPEGVTQARPRGGGEVSLSPPHPQDTPTPRRGSWIPSGLCESPWVMATMGTAPPSPSIPLTPHPPPSVSILVGAPKANTSQPNVTQGGAVYHCPWPPSDGCTPIDFDHIGKGMGTRVGTQVGTWVGVGSPRHGERDG